MFRRYTLVRQNDRSDCGAACLAMLAQHHRMAVGLERLRDLSGTDREGTNLLGLMRAAELLGFSAKAVKAPFEALASVPLPAIAHVSDPEGLGHFVVIYRFKNNKVVVADPVGKVETLGRDAFCARWTGKLLLATPSSTAAARTTTGHIAPWRRFVSLLQPHTAILVEVVVCALLMTVLAVSTSYFVQHLVDSVLARQERQLLNALGIGMTLVIVFKTLFSLLRQYLLAHVGRRVDLALIGDYMRHVLRLPARFFETRRVGEIFSRVTDAAKLRDAINGTATSAVVDATVVIGLLAVLWFHDLPLALATSTVVPVFLLSVALHHSTAKRRSQVAMENGAQLAAHLVEDVSGVETVKVFGAERLRSEQGESRLVSFAQSVFALQKLDIRVGSLALLITGLAGVGVLWYGGHRVMDGALTIGQLLFFYTLLATMLEPLNRLATVNLKIQDALVAVDRLFQILDLETEPSGHDKAPFHGLHREIELRGVGFSYGTRGKALDDINLRIPAGQTVAIVGESGSGKSTLLKLLLQFYQPTEGRILADGVDLRDYDLASLRSRMGVVTQDPYIFNGTIRENIALGRPGAPMEDVLAAARAAGLDEFIAGLPERYNTAIGERGANLSGGQRQRLAIARALLCRPDVLIFDEATSHLDTATERVIQESLRTVLAERTVILVAHRLSTVREADLICVVHGGRIVEQGTHRQLLARGGAYAALWQSQTADASLPIAHVPTISAGNRCGHLPAFEKVSVEPRFTGERLTNEAAN